jgi:hypothetical protein
MSGSVYPKAKRRTDELSAILNKTINDLKEYNPGLEEW